MDRRNLAFLAAVLMHVLILGIAQWASRWGGLASRPPPAPMLVEWDAPRKDRSGDRRLLLAPPRQANESSTPPENARYFSDRNRRVEKETQARSSGLEELARLQSPSLQRRLTAPGELATSAAKARNPTLSGEAQRLDDDRAAVGAENLLNTVESIHYSFYSRMHNALAPVWRNLVRSKPPERALSPGDYTVVASLVLDALGNVIGVEFQERSDIRQFNEAVIASARKVARFPNPPRNLMDERDQVRTQWSFTVNVGENSFLRFAPPRRLQ